MNLDDLRALMLVVEHGSFHSAADVGGVPRTKLRRQVERLEALMGAPLLRREAGGVSLTVAGELAVRRAGPLLGLASSLLAEVKAEGRLAGPPMRLIIPAHTIRPGPRVRALRRTEALAPELAIEVTETEAPLSLIRQAFDLMLHFGPPPPRDGWFSRVLARIPVSLVASTAYLAKAGTPERAGDLAEHRLLTWPAERRFAETWPRLDGGTVPIAPKVSSSNQEFLGQLADAGGGIALLPMDPRLRSPSSEQLVPVLEGVIGGETSLRVLSPHATRTDPRSLLIQDNIEWLLGLQLES